MTSINIKTRMKFNSRNMLNYDVNAIAAMDNVIIRNDYTAIHKDFEE